MLGMDPGPPPIVSFWSDLYDTRVQYLGHASLADAVSFEGDPATHRFTATFTREGRPVAVLLAGLPQLWKAWGDGRCWLGRTLLAGLL